MDGPSTSFRLSIVVSSRFCVGLLAVLWTDFCCEVGLLLSFHGSFIVVNVDALFPLFDSRLIDAFALVIF